MKYLLAVYLLVYSKGIYSQKIEDSKIIITLPNNADIYKKVKLALINTDFIVKDNYNVDTLSTYSREFIDMAGHLIAYAIINGNTIEITGFYSLKKSGIIGYPLNTNKFQKVLYYKSSKSWELLQQVAQLIGGKISYLK